MVLDDSGVYENKHLHEAGRPVHRGFSWSLAVVSCELAFDLKHPGHAKVHDRVSAFAAQREVEHLAYREAFVS